MASMRSLFIRNLVISTQQLLLNLEYWSVITTAQQ